MDADCDTFFERLTAIAGVLSIKLYRLSLHRQVAAPVLPCLDHEAMLHEGIAPHAAAYVEDSTGCLHEIVYTPSSRRIDMDVVSTMYESPPEARARFVAALSAHFPDCRVRETRVSWIRGDRRVAEACRAQVTLRDVLSGPDLDRTKAAVDRLQIISSLMEKESRVASWGARTVMTPLLAVAGFLTYQIVGSLDAQRGAAWVSLVRYAVVTVLGAFFLYYGLKAVHLTEMANRVWKRSAEYGLILAERRRLER